MSEILKQNAKIILEIGFGNPISTASEFQTCKNNTTMETTSNISTVTLFLGKKNVYLFLKVKTKVIIYLIIYCTICVKRRVEFCYVKLWIAPY